MFNLLKEVILLHNCIMWKIIAFLYIFVSLKVAGSAVEQLVEERRFSSLTKLVRVIAWVWRAANEEPS